MKVSCKYSVLCARNFILLYLAVAHSSLAAVRCDLREA